MAGIILFIILAILYTFNGDTSGIEAIGKVILYIALFLIVGSIIAYVPWLILVIVVGIIIFVFISSRNNNNSNSNSNYQQKVEYRPEVQNNTTYRSAFQNQLQQETKTPKEVENELLIIQKQEIIKQVESDYRYIKSEIMKKAQSGQYDNCSTGKVISVDIQSTQLTKYISHKLNQDIITSGGIRNQSVTYYISNTEMYNYYLSEITKVSNFDNIKISVVFKDNAKYIEFYNFPCTVSNIIVYPRDYSLCLRCSVEY